MRIEPRSILLNRVQVPDGDPSKESMPLFLLLGRIGEVDHDPRHKVTNPQDGRSLVEPPCPHHQVAETIKQRDSRK